MSEGRFSLSLRAEGSTNTKVGTDVKNPPRVMLQEFEQT
jgi:hypothetical protein